MRKPSHKSNKLNHKNSKTGEIRIIGGHWRGRKLKVQDKDGLRPTTDRLKETLFNWLMMDIRHARVLDCFAGAGSLGFEAASRGADQVVCIEKDTQAAKQLKANCELLQINTEQASQPSMLILNDDFFQSLNKIPSAEGFDIIFIDPPFNKNMIEPCLTLLVEQQLMNAETLVYIEQENPETFVLNNSELHSQLEIKKEKRVGQVLAQLLVFNP